MKKNERLINKIKVNPKRSRDRVFTGFIYIVEEDWAIYGVDLKASGEQVGIPIKEVLNLNKIIIILKAIRLGLKFLK